MTYASRLRARLDPKHPVNQSFGQKNVLLPDEYYEAQYVQKLYGQSTKPSVCPSCNIALPKTNECQYC